MAASPFTKHSRGIFSGLPEKGSLVGSSSNHKSLHSVICIKCSSNVGVFNVEKRSIDIFKWQVNCQTASLLKAPTAPECLAATLLASLSRSGSAKAVVLPIPCGVPTQLSDGGAQPSHYGQVLYAWILNPNISYTSSEEVGGPKNAVKLLYMVIDRVTADKLIEPVTSDIQDLSLAQDALDQSISFLNASNCLFPQEQRCYNDFKVGLLNRYENANI
ncbi:hypothetical protein jhhlp_007280 [Lomentospora prolificans]|uniref:Uncharacterized protein n=1 Tax=Lomentospora prolificans TaxID=41688 RepID=A0A2N3N295_9PEZI|nr:hypothetical protein jhhlp_007280 [Lomentospora prolificans]